MGNYTVREADARVAVNALPELADKVDVVITSPPYATALPYIDTDRLSLIYLRLLPREDHRTRDTLMIGNREVTKRVRTEYWAFYEAHRSLLPRSTRTLIERIDRLNKPGKVGFRRRNLAALLSKYFFDMREVLQQTFTLLRPGGRDVPGRRQQPDDGRGTAGRDPHGGSSGNDRERSRVPPSERFRDGHASVAGHLQEELSALGTDHKAREASIVSVLLLGITHGLATQSEIYRV